MHHRMAVIALSQTTRFERDCFCSLHVLRNTQILHELSMLVFFLFHNLQFQAVEVTVMVMVVGVIMVLWLGLVVLVLAQVILLVAL